MPPGTAEQSSGSGRPCPVSTPTTEIRQLTIACTLTVGMVGGVRPEADAVAGVASPTASDAAAPAATSAIRRGALIDIADLSEESVHTMVNSARAARHSNPSLLHDDLTTMSCVANEVVSS